jgi:G:T-mismatch repair DNA endonuclease (very short patch repair protein)
MSFIDFVENIKIDRLGRQFKSKHIKAECDQCGIIFTRKNNRNRSREILYNMLLFCNAECVNSAKKKNGKLNKKYKDEIMKKYNVENSFQIESVKHDYIKKCKEKYGGLGYGSKLTREKIEKTMLETYDFINPMHVKEIINKIDCKTSKVENEFYKFLEENFITVKRQQVVNRNLIDFFVEDHNVYIQLDGIYWHGIGRDINEIKKSALKRDKGILQCIERDKKQNFWFEQNNIRLIRITDAMFNEKKNANKILKMIREIK